MSLKGSFGTFYIATILQLLGDDRKTGILRVTKEDKEVQVFLQDGVIIYAKGSHTRDQLGKLLRTNGYITEQQLQECLAVSKENKQAIGKVLVEKGHITMEVLKKNICKQAENLIFDLFLWENGNFEYRDAKIDLKGLKIVEINTLQIILEATRRIDEMPLLKKQIPDERMVFQPVHRQDDTEIKLNEIEWRLLSLVDGFRTVGRIVHDSGYDTFKTYQILNALIMAGTIQPSDMVPPEVSAEKALSEIREMNSKQLRRILDQLGFSRSSTIRVALTRLLRDTMTGQDLLTAIKKEAALISATEDIQSLRAVQQSNQIPALQNTIHLLLEALENDAS